MKSTLHSYMNKRLQRLIRKYEFLLEDWQDVNEISTAANQEMFREINLNKPAGIFEEDYTKAEDVDAAEIQVEESDLVLKKLFRKIVVKCHPDKLSLELAETERFRLADSYEQAIEANNNKNWALMIIVAIKLGIDLPPEAEEKVEQIEQDVEDLERKIESATKSAAWQFYHADTEAKAEIIKSYINNLITIKTAKAKKPAKEKLILGLGHPRTGTGYTAKLLQSWGLDVGHEKLGDDGTVDWSLAVGRSIWQAIKLQDWNWRHIIYCVRDPRESIPSIVYTEDTKAISLNFRKENGVIFTLNPIVSAINSIVKWDRMINLLEPEIIYRIEDEGQELFEHLKSIGVEVEWSDTVLGQKQNTREHKSWEEMIAEFGELPAKSKIRINQYCRKYGYSPI
jgi:hypothetical protein